MVIRSMLKFFTYFTNASATVCAFKIVPYAQEKTRFKIRVLLSGVWVLTLFTAGLISVSETPFLVFFSCYELIHPDFTTSAKKYQPVYCLFLSLMKQSFYKGFFLFLFLSAQIRKAVNSAFQAQFSMFQIQMFHMKSFAFYG